MSKIIAILDHRISLYVLMPLSFFYLFLFFNQGINIYDEGLSVYGALRVLNGDIPYKDFWAIYSPAQFFVLAGFFKLFGVSIIGVRIWSTLIRFLLLLCTYFLARKFAAQKFALCTWLLLLIWLGSFQAYENPMISALLLTLLSILSVLNFLHKQSKLWLFIGGFSTGITTLYRHDIGFYTFVSVILIIFPFVYINFSLEASSVFKKLFQIIKVSSFYVLGAAIVLLPAVYCIFQEVPIDDLVFDFVQFPFEIYPKVRALPFPAPLPNPAHLLAGSISPSDFVLLSLNQLPFYGPLFVYIIIIIMLLISIYRRKISWSKVEIWGSVLILFLGMVFFNHARLRSDLTHLMATYIPAVILFAIILSFISNAKKYRILAWSLAFLLGFSFVGSSLDKTRRLFFGGLISSNKQFFELDRAKGIYGDREWVTSYQNAIKYIQDKVSDDERIYVGSLKHDQVVNSDIMFYFLSERDSATKFHDLHPGVATTEVIQKKIVDDLENKHVEYIVLCDDRESIAKKKSRFISSRFLDNFIQNNFVFEKKIGKYTIWKRRSSL